MSGSSFREQKPAVRHRHKQRSIATASQSTFELAQSIGSEQNTVSIWAKALCRGRFFKITPQSNRKTSIRSMSYKRGFEALKI
jgi:hypothetical protein